MKLLLGDCLSKLKELEDNSIDSIVTDPPYKEEKDKKVEVKAEVAEKVNKFFS